MDDPDWSVVLRTLHEHNAGNRFDPGEHDADDVTDFLTRRTGLDATSVREALFYLDEVGLVDVSEYISDPDDPAWDYNGLTHDGFRVAQERVMRDVQHRSNRSVVALTLVLATSASAQATATVFSPSVRGLPRLVSGGLLAVGMLVFALYFRTDIIGYVRA